MRAWVKTQCVALVTGFLVLIFEMDAVGKRLVENCGGV